MAKEYSPELCQYLGRVELSAHQVRVSERYWVFNNALEYLSSAGLSDEDSRLAGSSAGLSDEDSRLAGDILRTRAGETKPWNIGGASGEAGEAD